MHAACLVEGILSFQLIATYISVEHIKNTLVALIQNV
jgi:hypothetical protein